MTETEKAAQEAVELLTALFKVTRELGLSPEQEAAAVLDSLTACPRAPHWWDALTSLRTAGITMLKPTTTGKALPRRLHS
jgi:hypothetical protein